MKEDPRNAPLWDDPAAIERLAGLLRSRFPRVPSDLVDDAVAHAMQGLLQRSQSIRDPFSYAKAAAQNALVGELRRRARLVSLADAPEPTDEQADALLQDRQRLYSALAAILTPAERWLIEQRFFHNRPLDDLAAERGLTHPALRKRLSRAIEKLRRALSSRE